MSTSNRPKWWTFAAVAALASFGAFAVGGRGDTETQDRAAEQAQGQPEAVQEVVAKQGAAPAIWGALMSDLDGMEAAVIRRLFREKSDELNGRFPRLAEALREHGAADEVLGTKTTFEFIFAARIAKYARARGESTELALAVLKRLKHDLSAVAHPAYTTLVSFSHRALRAATDDEEVHVEALQAALEQLARFAATGESDGESAVSSRNLSCVTQVLADGANHTRKVDRQLLLAAESLIDTGHQSAATNYLTSLVIGDDLARWQPAIVEGFARKQAAMSWGLVEVLRYFILDELEEGADQARADEILSLVPDALLSHKNGTCRRAAIELVAEFCSKARAEELFQEAADGHPWAADLFFFLSDNLRLPTELFVVQLETGDPSVRGWVITALGKRSIWSTEAREVVCEYAREGSEVDRIEGIRALGRIPEAFAVELLGEMLVEDPDERIKVACVERLSPDHELSRELLERVCTEKEWSDELRLIAWSARLVAKDGRQFRSTLKAMSKSKIPAIQDRASACEMIIARASDTSKNAEGWGQLTSRVAAESLALFGIKVPPGDEQNWSQVSQAIDQAASSPRINPQIVASVSDIPNRRAMTLKNILSSLRRRN